MCADILDAARLLLLDQHIWDPSLVDLEVFETRPPRPDIFDDRHTRRGVARAVGSRAGRARAGPPLGAVGGAI